MRVAYPASAFYNWHPADNVEGVAYEPPPAAYGVPPHIKDYRLAEPMVRCPDGIVRRFPPSEDSSRNYLSQVEKGTIYDVPSELISQRIGGIELSPDRSQIAFKVAGYAVSPIQIGHGQFKAYALPSGRVIVPQPGFRDCTHACELMMLLDHGDVPFERVDRYNASNLGSRREISDIVSSLRAKSGREPVLADYTVNYKRGRLGGRHETRKQAWRDIARKIEQMGPCILSKNGHVVMLDSVREERGHFFLTIREPFHGTCVEFKDSAEFFADQNGTPDLRDIHFEAIFLPHRGAAAHPDAAVATR